MTKYGKDGRTPCECKENCWPGFSRDGYTWISCPTIAKRVALEAFDFLKEIAEEQNKESDIEHGFILGED